MVGRPLRPTFTLFAIEGGTPAKETCPDVVRACQLGDEANACLACIATDC